MESTAQQKPYPEKPFYGKGGKLCRPWGVLGAILARTSIFCPASPFENKSLCRP